MGPKPQEQQRSKRRQGCGGRGGRGGRGGPGKPTEELGFAPGLKESLRFGWGDKGEDQYQNQRGFG